MNAPYGTFVDTDNEQIATQDGTKVQRWWAKDVDGTAKSLDKSDVNGQFHDFTVTYDGKTRALSISYTQTSGKILNWTTTVSSSSQAMAMIVSASTGGAKNLQRFKIDSFEFQQAATVNVKYVDMNNNQIAQSEVTYPNGANVNGTYETKQLDIPNYKFVKMGDGSLDAKGTLKTPGDNGTVIYVYDQYKQEVRAVNQSIQYVDQKGNAVSPTHTATPVHFLKVTNPVDNTTTIYYTTKDNASQDVHSDGTPIDSSWIKADGTSFAEVLNSKIAGYKVISNDAPNSDLTKVAAQTVKSTDNDSAYTVVYAPAYSAASRTVNQTIKYVDQAGKVVSEGHTATPVSFLTVTNPVDGTTTVYYTTNASASQDIDNNGVPTDSSWKKGDSTSFAEVVNPAVAGYKVISNDAPNSDLTKVAAQTVK
ncbi:MAG: MucBP domain-containing protein, partial [Lactobacillus sp.]